MCAASRPNSGTCQATGLNKKTGAVNLSEPVSPRDQWSSRWVFVLAATGSAVGLGNIWKFPYIVGENGGGAFVLLYLFCVLFITLPIMMAEVLLGYLGKRDPIDTMAELAHRAGASRRWGVIGLSGVVAGFLILSYYSVIAGWTMAYIGHAAGGDFNGADVAQISGLFDDLLASPWRLLGWHSLFMVLTIAVVARGVRAGLEKALTILMPGLLLLLVALVLYAATTPAFAEGAAFLFKPDFSKLTASAVLVAMGHAFFTLSLGMGAIMIYGSYLPAGSSVARVSLVVALADTVIALLAGLAIFPLVFTHGLEPGQGPGLLFVTLPNAFAQIVGGQVVGCGFFLLMLFAAWSSAISLIEPAVAWMVERFGWSRLKAALVGGVIAWATGLLTVVSFNLAADFHPLGGSLTMFELIDFLTTNVMLPLGGVLIALFAGWRLLPADRIAAMADVPAVVVQLWLWSVRIVAPVAVLLVMVAAIASALQVPMPWE
ncbi:MAG: sodium-dependent transporter [Gammaproteobacteria bacterium]|nr:MAG: sodium-dependent transporter [Gammaproteobacteria bacterium]RLA13364.1 MAG: sodium-dependent transporter [Gammaproteobacteria bacterium]RLA14530.1 MAG: sodium-dependent transporter [Gammaproteobacteria bacterium]